VAYLYNVKAVVKETGVKANTLRAWERRYQLPMPTRSQGGQRQYSAADIATIKWLRARKDEGMSIQVAVNLWNETIADGKNPAENFSSAELEKYNENETAIEKQSPENFKQRWVKACLDFDEYEAENVIRQAFSFFELQIVCLDILQDGLVEIGRLWYLGDATVQQEHFASALTVRRLNALIAANSDATREGRIIVATPSNEEHVVSSLILTLLLRQSGFHVVNLGANVPQDGLKIMLNIIDPDLAVFSSTHIRSLPSLHETANYLAELGTQLAYGGRIFSKYHELQGRIPGHYLGNDLLESRRMIEEFLEKDQDAPEKTVPNEDLQNSRKAFAEHRAAIEKMVDGLFGRATKDLETHHRFTADNISATLALGLDNPLHGELAWAREYVDRMPDGMPSLKEYLDSYLRIAKQELSHNGGPVITWLHQALTSLQ